MRISDWSSDVCSSDLKTADAVDAAGWMHTGDLAVLDEEGYCNIVGRVKDMVIRGGENLFPREIEEYLYRHPNVQDVQVFGIPDARYGEELCAWIVPKPGQRLTEEDIRGFCWDRSRIRHSRAISVSSIPSSPQPPAQSEARRVGKECEST